MRTPGSSRLLELLEHHFALESLERSLGVGAEAIPTEVWEAGLLGPLRDFLGRPGKSLRAGLVQAAWRASGAPGAAPEMLAVMIEVLHAGSLVIDDIEDDAVERRGRPALHRLYGIPRALNAGNWLYFWSELLLGSIRLDPARELEARRWLARTIFNCHHGQAIDLSARATELGQSQIPELVSVVTKLKTGSLIALAMRLGALAAEAKPEDTEALASFGSSLGTALQMLDDLGGIASEPRWHKGQEDLVGARPTWPWAWLAAQLDSYSFARLRELARAVEASQLPATELASAMRSQLGDSATARVDAHLAATLDVLRSSVPDASRLTLVQMTIDRLRGSYG
ncbi:MAG: polyprenyl synthetase family protein [Polyangiaceae bacterium]|nr:polyprenyl synthetase family protein [Polyangiaceae bacterium]